MAYIKEIKLLFKFNNSKLKKKIALMVNTSRKVIVVTEIIPSNGLGPETYDSPTTAISSHLNQTVNKYEQI